MVTLEPVIRVRELPPALSRVRGHLGSIRELVSPAPASHEPAILTYLAQGVAFEIYNDPGLLWDVLERGRRLDAADAEARSQIQPGLILTDGTWVWDGVLSYYVARYHLQLPERFVLFAASKGWRIDPETVNVERLTWDAYEAESAPADSARSELVN